MFDGIRFEGHIEGNHIVPDVPLNLPEKTQVSVWVEKVAGRKPVEIILGKQDLSKVIGIVKAEGPFNVGNLSREEIYRDDL